MVVEIVSDFKELYVWFANWVFYRRHAFKLNLAIRLADMKQQAFNKQYHVMLIETPKGDKLVSVNNTDIERFKQKKWLPKNEGMLELKQKSIFYSTPLTRNNKSTVKQRKEAREKYTKYASKYMKGV